MPIVLSNNTLAAQLPKPRVMIRATRDQIRTIGAKSTVPHPSLMAMERGFERESSGVAVVGCREVIGGEDVVGCRCVDGPDAGCVIGRAGGQVADVWGEEDAGDVCGVSQEFTYGEYGCGFATLNHTPDVDVALGRSKCQYVLYLDLSGSGETEYLRHCYQRIPYFHH